MLNKIRTVAALAICVALPALLPGCSSTNDAKAQGTKPEAVEEAIPPTPGLTDKDTPDAAAKKMIEGVLKGLSDGSYAMYSRDFSEKHKEFFDKTKFDTSSAWFKEKLGDRQSLEFMGFWTRRGYFLALWKAKYSKIKDDDVVLEMCFKQEAGTYKVEAFKPR